VSTPIPITRAELAAFVRDNWENKKPIPDKKMRDYRGLPHHYGKCEVRALMDKLYGGPPTSEEEAI
jgi:hypothetical protein